MRRLLDVCWQQMANQQQAMEAQAANMAVMQEMMRSMKAAMDAMTKGAQGENPEGPANGFKGPSSEAPAVPEGGPEQPEDRPEKSAQGPADKGPLGGKNPADPRGKGKAKMGEPVGQGPRRPAHQAPSQVCSEAQGNRQAHSARAARGTSPRRPRAEGAGPGDGVRRPPTAPHKERTQQGQRRSRVYPGGGISVSVNMESDGEADGAHSDNT